MNKKAYIAPIVELEEMDCESLLKVVSTVKGDAGIKYGGQDNTAEGMAADSRRLNNVWDDGEEW